MGEICEIISETNNRILKVLIMKKLLVKWFSMRLTGCHLTKLDYTKIRSFCIARKADPA